jgi:hypothetical protein
MAVEAKRWTYTLIGEVVRVSEKITSVSYGLPKSTKLEYWSTSSPENSLALSMSIVAVFHVLHSIVVSYLL